MGLIRIQRPLTRPSATFSPLRGAKDLEMVSSANLRDRAEGVAPAASPAGARATTAQTLHLVIVEVRQLAQFLVAVVHVVQSDLAQAVE